MILFDFDKAIIEGKNKSIIDFIKSRIEAESHIEISGYADRTGNDEYNKKLSERRAQAAKSALKRSDAIIAPNDASKPIINNDLPEGRFYSRTVEIIVRSPVK